MDCVQKSDSDCIITNFYHTNSSTSPAALPLSCVRNRSLALGGAAGRLGLNTELP